MSSRVLACLSLFLVTAAFLSAACGQSTALPELPAGWEWYHDDQGYNYDIGYPGGWTFSTFASPTSLNKAIWFYDPNTGARIAVAVGERYDASLENFVADDRIAAEGGASYLYEGYVSLNGRQGYEAVFTYPSVDGNMTHHAVWFLVKGKGYVLTCSALEDDYSQYGGIFDTAIDSFQIR